MKHLITIITVMGLMVTSGFGITQSELSELQKKYDMSEARIKEVWTAKYILSRLYFISDDRNDDLASNNDRFTEEVKRMINQKLGDRGQFMRLMDSSNDYEYSGPYVAQDLSKVRSRFHSYVHGLLYKDASFEDYWKDIEIERVVVELFKDESIALSEKEAYIGVMVEMCESFNKDDFGLTEELNQLLNNHKMECGPEFGGVKLCKTKEVKEDSDLMVTSGREITRSELKKLQKKYDMDEERVNKFLIAKRILNEIHDYKWFTDEVKNMIIAETGTQDSLDEMYFKDLKDEDNDSRLGYLYKYFVENTFADTISSEGTSEALFLYQKLRAQRVLAGPAIDALIDLLGRPEGYVPLDEKKARIRDIYGVYKSFIEDGNKFRQELDKVLHDKMGKSEPAGQVELCKSKEVKEDCGESVEVGM